MTVVQNLSEEPKMESISQPKERKIFYELLQVQVLLGKPFTLGYRR